MISIETDTSHRVIWGLVNRASSFSRLYLTDTFNTWMNSTLARSDH